MEEEELLAHSNYYPLIDLITNETYEKKANLTDNLRLKLFLEKSNEEKKQISEETKDKIKSKIGKYKGRFTSLVISAINDLEYFTDDSPSLHIDSEYIVRILFRNNDINVLNEKNLLSLENLKTTKHTFVKEIIEFINIFSLVGLFHDLILVEDALKNGNLTTFENQKLNWYGSQTEFIELIKALIENNTLRGTQKAIIESTSVFFGLTINNPDKLIQDVKKRNTGSETLFLDKLKTNLYEYIQK